MLSDTCAVCGKYTADKLPVGGGTERPSWDGRKQGSSECPGCGDRLPESASALVKKVSQLARFGLSAGSEPLLELESGNRRRRDVAGRPS